MNTAEWNIKSLLSWSTDYLTQKGSPTGRLDAELLLAETLGCNRLQLYMAFDKPLAETEKSTFRQLLKRRSAGEPVAYILGRKFFWQWEFDVSPDVLIPRPETELLLEEALAFVKKLGPEKEVRILDVGTGSGCLAISLGLLCPHAQIVAVDVSEAALRVAMQNATKLSVKNVSFLHADIFSDLPLWDGDAFHLIVSNPPYIDGDKRGELPVGVSGFEPHVALFADKQGCGFHDFLAENVARILAPEGGTIMVEFGFDQSQKIKSLFEENGWRNVEVKKDLAKIDRVLIARR